MVEVLQPAMRWLRSMAWHLWRIASGWPAYRAMSDTMQTTVSFLGLYAAAATIRLVVAEGHPASLVVGLLIAEVAFNAAISIRRGRGLLLFNALIGVSFMAHLTLLVLSTISGDRWLAGSATVVLALFSGARAFRLFRRMPAEVRARGWRPDSGEAAVRG